ncbi:hypothetical protein AJ90_03370 [Vibrio parahaemolyticus M0605]|nr:hypothetical protein AJ90_03370 [Vibrio parahaemolyticus M0605]
MALIPRCIADFSEKILPFTFLVIQVVKIHWTKVEPEITQMTDSQYFAAATYARKFCDFILHRFFQTPFTEVIITFESSPMPPASPKAPNFFLKYNNFIQINRWHKH